LPGWRSLVVFLQGTYYLLGVCLYHRIVCFAQLELSLMSTCFINARTRWRFGLTSVLHIYRPPVITTRVLCLAEPGTVAIFPRPLNNFEASLSGHNVCSLERNELQNLQGHIFNSASLHLPHRQDDSRPPALHSSTTATSASSLPDAALLFFFILSCLIFSFL